MSLIVVEGVDGSGKTTLIQSLREASICHFVTLSRSSPPKTLEEITDVLMWMEKGAMMATPLICDRHPLISEPIYGNVLRGYSLLDRLTNYEDHWSLVDRVIYVRPSMDTIFKFIGHQPQLKGVIRNLERLIVAYDEKIESLRDKHVKVITYNREVINNPSLAALFYGDVR